MFRNALHASIGAQGQRLDARGLRSRPGAVARFIVEAAFAALVVALFIGWLISRPGSDLASGRGSQCVSLGRGGALAAVRRSAKRITAPSWCDRWSCPRTVCAAPV